MTKIVKAFPPNIDAIRARFGQLPVGTVFAYGDTIYAPSTTDLPSHLVAHERVHFAQQEKAGGPEAWWQRYLDDARFRLEQEVEAYRVQWAEIVRLPRDERRELLRHICRSLSGSMYGRLVTKEQARHLITRGATA